MRNLFILVLGSTLLFAGTRAFAVCTTDIECKGDRICENGACVSPGAASPETAPAPVEEAAPAVGPAPAPAPETTSDPVPVPATPAPAVQPAGVPAPITSPGQPCVDNAGCQGGEYCENRVCVPIGQPLAPPRQTLTDGWALGGAIAGFVSIGLVTGLGVPSAITSEEMVPSLPLGISATVVFGVMAPLTHSSGKSARRGGGVRGSLGLRVPAWVAYGMGLFDAVVLIGLGASSADVPYAPFIASTVALGDLALALFAAEALVARRQVKQEMAKATTARRGPALQLAPAFSFVPGRNGISGTTLGVRGVF